MMQFLSSTDDWPESQNPDAQDRFERALQGVRDSHGQGVQAVCEFVEAWLALASAMPPDAQPIAMPFMPLFASDEGLEAPSLGLSTQEAAIQMRQAETVLGAAMWCHEHTEKMVCRAIRKHEAAEKAHHAAIANAC